MRFDNLTNPVRPSLVLPLAILGLLFSLASCSPVSQPVPPTALPTPASQTDDPEPTISAETTGSLQPPGLATIGTATIEPPAAFATTALPVLPTPTPTVVPEPPVVPLAGIEMASPYLTISLEKIQEAGAYFTKRNGLLWSVVETTEGQYNWGAVANLETELADAAARGLEMILIVRGTPFWAQAIPGYPCGPIAPEKLAAFGDFMFEAVQRYSQPPFNVKYWEIWNEPDAGWRRVNSSSQFGCWGDEDKPFYGGEAYGEMLQRAYPRMKDANPDAQVLVGGLLLDCDPRDPPEEPAGSGIIKDCSPATFLEGILNSGGGDFFDGVSFHGYDLYYASLGDYRNPNWHSAWNTTGPVLLAKANFIQELLDAYGYPDKYILNTEVALLCGRNGEEAICRTDDYENSKAYFLVQAFAAAQAVGLRANIWFSLRGWRGSELVSSSNLVPNRAYQAFSFTADVLKGAAYLGEVAAYPGIVGYRFKKGDEELWLFWSKDGASHFIDLPAVPTAQFDVYGEPQPTGIGVEVTLAPIWAVFPGP